MKNLILLISLFLFTPTAFSTQVNVSKGDTIIANGVDTINATQTNTLTEAERLIDKYGGKVYDVIQGLADQLKVPAEYVYKVYTNQFFASGLIAIIMTSFFLIFGLTLIVKCVRNYSIGCKKFNEEKEKKYTSDDYCETFKGVSQVIGTVLGVIMLLASVIAIIVTGPESLTQMVNPEYYTIKEILSLVK